MKTITTEQIDAALQIRFPLEVVFVVVHVCASLTVLGCALSGRPKVWLPLIRTGALIDRSLRFAIELQAQVLGFEAAL